jgi:hypothetical protein
MKRFILATLTLCLFASLAVAQSTNGRLLGNVNGPDGLLPGATITITDNATGRTQTTTSSDNGSYKFERVPFGAYTVRVTANGFKTYVGTNVRVDANQDYTLNPKLEVGDVSVEVEVTAGADLVNASDGELSTTVDQKQILDLPINGRNPLALLSLQAGVNTPAGNHVNGQRTSSTNFTRDGVNVQDNFIRTGGFVQDRPTVDDTGEFNVTTQNAGAELGGGGSAQIQLVTPRGGSELHGAGYIYNRNSAFSANTFGNNATDTERPFLNRNQFGGRVGGPLPFPGFGQGTPIFFKDKAFFFVNYERFLLRQQSSATAVTLLNQFRNGTFNYTDLNGVARSVNVLTGAGFTGAIPAANGGAIAGVNPIIQSRVLDLAPGTGNGTLSNGGLSQQVRFNQANNDTRDAVTARFDVNINDSNSVYFVYKYNKNADDRTDIDNTFNTVPVNTQGGPTQGYLLSYTTVLGSNFTNELRGAYNQSDPFFNQDPNFPTDFVLGGIPFLTNPQSTFQKQGRKTDQYTLQNNSTYSAGNHTLRFGIDANLQRIASETNFNQVGIYNINGGNTNTPTLPTGLFPGGASSTDRGRANSLRWLLGGFIGSGTISAEFVNPQLGPQLGASNREKFRYETYGLYFADSWRVTPELTLNLGMRWDYFTPVKNPDIVYLEPDLTGASGRDQLRTRLLDPTNQYVLLGTSIGKPGQFFTPDYNNFGPVVSFAYSPRSENSLVKAMFGESGVIRGGFRIGYINDEYVRGPDNAAGGNVGLDLTGRLLQNGSTSINAILGQNVPSFTLPAFTPPPISFATSNVNAGNSFNTVFAIDPDLQMQRNMQYNVSFAREIGFDTAIEFRYVGGRSNNMVRGFDFNQVIIRENGFLQDFINARNNCRIHAQNFGLTLNDGCFDPRNNGLPGQVDLPVFGQMVAGGLLTNGTVRGQIQRGQAGNLAVIYFTNGLEGNVQFRRNPNAGVVDLLTNDGRYRYNAFQFEVRKRFTDGLQFQGNYTFGKTLSDIQGDGQSRFDPFLDLDQPQLEYARADYDRTHTININANYELPFGKGKKFLNSGGIVDKIVGGWQFTSIIQMSSGTPISVEYNLGTLNRDGRSARGTAISSLTTDQIRALTGIFFQPDGTILYIDPSVIGPDGSAANGNVEAGPGAGFAGQVFFQPQPGETGSLGRNILDGPWYYNWDAGIIKNTRFGENFNVQFRAEAFNVLNNTNFFIGEGSNIFEIRNTQFGQISSGSTYSPRIMQFAVRLEF